MFICPGIPEEAYNHFSRRMHNKVVADRVPIVGALELTMRCNLRCVHCYCNQAGNNIVEDESDTGFWLGVIDQLAAAGCLWLLITGGEPLVRPDFREIYLHAKQLGIFPTVFTNATLVTDEIAALFAEWRPFSIEVSLYGASAATYKDVTGAGINFERCLRGINILIDHGLKPQLKTMVMRENIHELDAMHELAASLNLEFRFDALLNPTVGGDMGPASHRIEPEQVAELDHRYGSRVESWREFLERFGQSPPIETLFSCGAGINAFHVDPGGRLHLCLLARGESYDLTQGTFRDGWNGVIRELRSRRPDKPHKCGSCSLRSLCGCCPGWSTLETGSPEEPVPYLCKVATLRAEAFGPTPGEADATGMTRSAE